MNFLKEAAVYFPELQNKVDALTNEEAEKLYAAAFAFYEGGSYEKAEKCFTRYVLQFPFEKKGWKGLASARQMASQYKKALSAWAILCLLEESDPTPHFHAAECLIALQEFQQAHQALNCAKKRAGDDRTWKEKVEILGSRIPCG